MWQESWGNKLRVLLAKFLLPKADGIRVVSERIKNSLVANRQSLIARISVLPIFVDVKKIQSAKIKTDLHKKYPEYDFIILMASRLTKEKNIFMAIEAIKEILKRKNLNPKPFTLNPLLLIVGDGPERKNLELRIMNYELGNNVKIENWTDDLASYYKTADLFLLASNYEGYGRTVIEAMASRLPVVMTDVGLAGELLIDDLGGRIAPVGDAGAFMEAILELIGNFAKREEFKKNSLKLLEKWPVKQEYLENYKKLLMFRNPNSKIKVAFFGDDFSRKGKGTALVVQKIAEQFVNEFSGQIELVIMRKAGKCDNQTAKKVRNIEIKRIPFLGTAISYLLFFIFNKEKFDIVMFNKLVYPGFWLLNSKKFVLLAHDAPVSPVYEEKLMFSGRLFYWFLGAIGKYFLDSIIVDSEDAKREIIRYHRLDRNKVFVIYLSAGDEFRKFSGEEKIKAKELIKRKYQIAPPYILDVSRLDPHKNILNVLGAYLIFRDKFDFSHRLVFVGGSHTSEYSELVKARALNSGFKDDILFAEYIEPEDLPALYNLADILVFPSLLGRFWLAIGGGDEMWHPSDNFQYFFNAGNNWRCRNKS